MGKSSKMSAFGKRGINQHPSTSGSGRQGPRGRDAIGEASSQFLIKWENLPYWPNVPPKQTLYDHDWEQSQLFLQTEVSGTLRGNSHQGQNKQGWPSVGKIGVGARTLEF